MFKKFEDSEDLSGLPLREAIVRNLQQQEGKRRVLDNAKFNELRRRAGSVQIKLWVKLYLRREYQLILSIKKKTNPDDIAFEIFKFCYQYKYHLGNGLMYITWLAEEAGLFKPLGIMPASKAQGLAFVGEAFGRLWANTIASLTGNFAYDIYPQWYQNAIKTGDATIESMVSLTPESLQNGLRWSAKFLTEGERVSFVTKIINSGSPATLGTEYIGSLIENTGLRRYAEQTGLELLIGAGKDLYKFALKPTMKALFPGSTEAEVEGAITEGVSEASRLVSRAEETTATALSSFNDVAEAIRGFIQTGMESAEAVEAVAMVLGMDAERIQAVKNALQTTDGILQEGQRGVAQVNQILESGVGQFSEAEQAVVRFSELAQQETSTSAFLTVLADKAEIFTTGTMNILGNLAFNEKALNALFTAETVGEASDLLKILAVAERGAEETSLAGQTLNNMLQSVKTVTNEARPWLSALGTLLNVIGAIAIAWEGVDAIFSGGFETREGQVKLASFAEDVVITGVAFIPPFGPVVSLAWGIAKLALGGREDEAIVDAVDEVGWAFEEFGRKTGNFLGHLFLGNNWNDVEPRIHHHRVRPPTTAQRIEMFKDKLRESLRKYPNDGDYAQAVVYLDPNIKYKYHLNISMESLEKAIRAKIALKQTKEVTVEKTDYVFAGDRMIPIKKDVKTTQEQLQLDAIHKQILAGNHKTDVQISNEQIQGQVAYIDQLNKKIRAQNEIHAMVKKMIIESEEPYEPIPRATVMLMFNSFYGSPKQKMEHYLKENYYRIADGVMMRDNTLANYYKEKIQKKGISDWAKEYAKNEKIYLANDLRVLQMIQSLKDQKVVQPKNHQVTRAVMWENCPNNLAFWATTWACKAYSDPDNQFAQKLFNDVHTDFETEEVSDEGDEDSLWVSATLAYSKKQRILYVAFRGTDFNQLSDAGGDAENFKKNAYLDSKAGWEQFDGINGKYHLHSGFVEFFRRIEDRVYAKVQERLRTSIVDEVIMCGHSLGASGAEVACVSKTLGSVATGKITIGQPRVMWEEDIEKYNAHMGNRSWRLQNRYDYVSALSRTDASFADRCVMFDGDKVAYLDGDYQADTTEVLSTFFKSNLGLLEDQHSRTAYLDHIANLVYARPPKIEVVHKTDDLFFKSYFYSYLKATAIASHHYLEGLDHLTGDMIIQFIKEFQEIDEDGDGEVSIAELVAKQDELNRMPEGRKFITNNPVKASDIGILERDFRKYDEDGNGTLDLDEYIRAKLGSVDKDEDVLLDPEKQINKFAKKLRIMGFVMMPQEMLGKNVYLVGM